MAAKRSDWIADLRRRHRSETILVLLQLQELGPGLYSTKDLVDALGIQSSSVNLALARLKCAGLLRYEGWCKKGRLIWWIADFGDTNPNPARFPRWVLRITAAREVEVLFGRQREAADRLGVHWKTFSNFLSGRYCGSRLLGEWYVAQNPVQFITQSNAYFQQPVPAASDRDRRDSRSRVGGLSGVSRGTDDGHPGHG